MNIFITNSKSGAFFEIANGWRNAFNSAGHSAELWNGDEKIWQEFKPDIFIGCSGWKQPFARLISRYSTKLAIHVNPYCAEQIQIRGGPAINEGEPTIKWVLG